MSIRNLILALGGLVVIGAITVALVIAKFSAELPELIGIADYKPLQMSAVYDRNGKKFGEFWRQKRILTPYDQIPQNVIHAFIAAEDASFFHHKGLNYLAIARAFFANMQTGRKGQGGSTITQQVARGLLLSNEKTYSRKIKEVLIARKMEETLKKEEIIYLYLNQIFLGQNAYGVGAAAQIYFRKDIKDLTVPEAAILAGLPQAPSTYSPIRNPAAAKVRQRYVLERMAEEGFITKEQAHQYAMEPVKLFVKENFEEMAPFYLETVRQMAVAAVGEEMVFDKGVKIYTSMDFDKQIKAQEEIRNGLRALDKRQGFRGPLKNLTETKDIAEFLLESRNKAMDESSPERIMKADGTFDPRGPLNLTGKDDKGQPMPVLPAYIPIGKIVDGVVTKVDDVAGLTYVRFAETKGLIDLESMAWARKPDPNLRSEDAAIKKPSAALKVGDVIHVKVMAPEFKSERLDKHLAELKKKSKGKAGATIELPDFKAYTRLELEQEPLVEGALLSVDERSEDVIALVGGYDFVRSKYNRALQAARQTGSSFKALVYLAALDKDYTPATPIIDAPVVYEEVDEGQDGVGGKGASKEPETKTWRPKNNSNKFGGDVLFRNALIKSLNVPTVKIIERTGVEWAATYARRLGIFSPLNMDFTLALGSSGVTLYEMTRAFGTIGRMGHRLRPVVIRKIVDQTGKEIATNITLDDRYKAEVTRIDEEFEQRRQNYLKETTPSKKEPPIYFQDSDVVVRPQTAYVLTTMLQGVVDEAGGTGGAARSLGRPVAGKTGTTSAFYDAWFMGYTPDIVTGVWVGFDEEKTIGRGEVGGKSALPIWLEYMKFAHEGLPPRGFPVPDGIVFANIDNETGQLVSSSSKAVVRQAFIDGTEPGSVTSPTAARKDEEDKNFLKEEMESE
ncbi:MAG: PBP1A family penicillin-binding protein [Bdellovibrionales bacterium]|nr:PBP1A family penicillin-binding protein [Bdellovibrionales bacterium]